MLIILSIPFHLFMIFVLYEFTLWLINLVKDSRVLFKNHPFLKNPLNWTKTEFSHHYYSTIYINPKTNCVVVLTPKENTCFDYLVTLSFLMLLAILAISIVATCFTYCNISY